MFGIFPTPPSDPDIDAGLNGQPPEIGAAIRWQRCEKFCMQHPAALQINNVTFVAVWHEPTLSGSLYKNVQVFSAGELDRSPGGTGTSAMMAMRDRAGGGRSATRSA